MRLATMADRAAIEKLVQAADQPWADLIGSRPRPMDDDYGALIAQGRIHLTGTDPVDGLIVLLPDGDALLVDNVAVDPAVHGKGVGRRLLAFAENEARRRGLNATTLFTHSMMASNLRLYASLGYVETHRKEIDSGHLVFMRKQLP
jgi:GNAT superfamily N-acetyltransferase